eukprot:CAMPEP_0197934096 /NCGR_PEP_ID=MMETSP1439-20131203/111200_1 /TAXON_ID=66791 /ORGANISM="Gonyaulax spinifera, Strain CCMP409" /LENGTH=39 /DNA_ID= /DNA_START= /DNA_END= /DNA_ORIENTATION=
MKACEQAARATGDGTGIREVRRRTGRAPVSRTRLAYGAR